MSIIATRGSYPHPVLDQSDDVASSFEVFNVSITPSVDDVELRFQIRMDDPDIQSLLEEGKARYSFRWKCSSTIASGELDILNMSEHADSTGYVAWIDQQEIRRTVRVELKIIAAMAIEGYRLERQHPDYGGAVFDLLPGDIIADGGYFDFEPDKLYDPLEPPVGSCFRFVAESKQRKGLKVHFHDDEYVVVAFPPKLLPGFAGLANRPDLQISLVVLPALIETVTYIRDNLDPETGEDLTGRSWYRPIVSLVEGVGSFDDSAFELAQKILGSPLEASLLTSLEVLEDE